MEHYMKLFVIFFKIILFTSISFSQIVDVFISDWYIGWRGDGIYNNLVELYNPKEDTVDLSEYLMRRTQNGSDWLSTDPSHFIRLSGIIPPGETYTITREAADDACDDCANLTYPGGEAAGYIDPNSFLKQSGDDAVGIFYIGALGNDTAAWVESGTLLDAMGVPNSDPGNAWDVSGVPEATRYHILQRKFNICGGNGGDWNASRGCVDDACTETSAALSEWDVINCVLADPLGSLYPEPETQDASGDMQIICGGHAYLCLDAPNSAPGEFSLESPVDLSILNVNINNLNEELLISWSESYDSDGHDLHYTFDLYSPAGDTLLSVETLNETEISLSYQAVYDLLGPENSVACYWDLKVTDLYDTTGTSNGPFLLVLNSDQEGGLNQPTEEFELVELDDYSLVYVNEDNLEESLVFDWEVSTDPDNEPVTYTFLLSMSEQLVDADSILLDSNSYELQLNEFYQTMVDEGVEAMTLYWNVSASDGAFDQISNNGPYMFHLESGQDPTDNDETYLDLFITDWYIGHRSSPVYNAAVELYNPREEAIDLSNYVLRRTQNGSHWLNTSWIRLEGILPPNTTYVVTRQASIQDLQDCSDHIDPDDFLKHNGDDGFKVTTLEYLPETLQDDTTAWLKMALTLDAIGYENEDPGSAWDVSGIQEATRYYILSRNMDVCGGNGGDWNSSRGCVDEQCDSTSAELGEWTPLACALSPSPGDMPEGPDASTDALIFCGVHNYFCSLSTLSENILPQRVSLEQNYPNPFNPITEIQFNISMQSHAVLKVYNIMGQEIVTLIDQNMNPGKHMVTWYGKDEFGRDLSSGMYLYELEVGDISIRKKLILLK